MARVRGRDRGEGRRLSGDDDLAHRQSHPEHEQPHPPQLGARVDQRHQREVARQADQADDDEPARTEAAVEDARAELGAEHHAEGLGQRVEPGLQRGESQAELEEQRDDEQRAEERGRGDGHRRARRAEQPVAEQAQPQQRGSGTQFDPYQQCQDGRPRGDAGDDLRVCPAEAGALADPVHHGGEPRAGQHESGGVEAPGPLRALLGQEEQAEGERRDADEQVDEEHPAPGQARHQRAAEDRAERGGDGGRDGQDG